MGSSSLQPVQQTSTTTSDPWGPQQPYIKQIFSEAQRLYNDPTKPQYYPGQTFADPSQATLQGLAGAEARAQQGNPLVGQAQGEIGKTLSGEYLRPDVNPYLQGVVESTKAAVLPGIDSRFIQAGRSGSGLHGRAVGEGLGSALGNLYNTMYQSERDRMTNAVAAAPGLAQADYLDPMMLGQIGQQREAIAQKPIDEAIGRWQFDQNSQQAKLADYLQMVQGNYGGTSNTVGTQFLPRANPLGQVLGGLLGGVGTAASLGWKPFGRG